jgi:hypothetical protein
MAKRSGGGGFGFWDWLSGRGTAETLGAMTPRVRIGGPGFSFALGSNPFPRTEEALIAVGLIAAGYLICKLTR